MNHSHAERPLVALVSTLARVTALVLVASSAVAQPAAPSSTTTLEAFEVLGSRIRRTEVDGPSPVSVYNAEEIRASGAMNLADFMRTLPQTYSGVGAGRNSTPDGG